MRNETYEIGDKVIIRDWDDMASEFGDNGGSIPCRCGFVPAMREYCGKILTIKELYGSCSVIFEEDIGNRFSWSTDMIRLLKPNGKKQQPKKPKTYKCSCCGQVVKESSTRKASNGSRVCAQCLQVKNYSTKNNTVFHKPTKSNKTYGFELECVPRSMADRASMSHSKYHLIPTADSSLPSGGIEYKTPTYNGLTGLRKLFGTFEKYVNFSDERCGQHINIGDREYLNESYMNYIRRYAPSLFNPLYSYMSSHFSDTVKVVGRFFTTYASNDYGYNHHRSWINLLHNNRIEFRLSKFVSANQYFELACMWTEMIDCMIQNFLIPCANSSSRVNLANKTSTMLVEIFKTYASGKAKCQERAS